MPPWLLLLLLLLPALASQGLWPLEECGTLLIKYLCGAFSRGQLWLCLLTVRLVMSAGIWIMPEVVEVDVFGSQRQ